MPLLLDKFENVTVVSHKCLTTKGDSLEQGQAAILDFIQAASQHDTKICFTYTHKQKQADGPAFREALKRSGAILVNSDSEDNCWEALMCEGYDPDKITCYGTAKETEKYDNDFDKAISWDMNRRNIVTVARGDIATLKKQIVGKEDNIFQMQTAAPMVYAHTA